MSKLNSTKRNLQSKNRSWSVTYSIHLMRVEGLKTSYIDSPTLEQLNIRLEIINPEEEERTQQATEWNRFFQPMSSFLLARFPTDPDGDPIAQEILYDFERHVDARDIAHSDRTPKGIYRMHAGHYAMRENLIFQMLQELVLRG